MPSDADKATATSDRKLRRDLKVLARFIEVHCRHRHRVEAKAPTRLRNVDVRAICGRPLCLCADCRKLLAHGFVKRMRCPLDPKPSCRKCPTHCYAPAYRARIRQVMKYSGRRLVLSGRVHYLYHLFA